MRVLFLSARHPFPPDRGDRRRALHFLSGLARHAEVTLACFGSGPPLPVEGVRVESVGRRLPGAVRANLGRPDPRLPLQVRLHLDVQMRRLVQRELERFSPDVVHATLTRMAPYLPARGSCHRHLDLVDSLSLNMQGRARASTGLARLGATVEAGLLRGFEARSAAAADSFSLASAADRRAASGLDEAAVIGNGVDLAAFPFRLPEDEPGPLLFFGNLGYFHNVEPARFAAEAVIPVVRRERTTTLRIAGARPVKAVAVLDRLPGVSVVGPVPDMARELRHAGVALLPMFSGSGVKNKVLEAFSSGTPVVTNRSGIQGIEGARPGVHYLAGETAAELAEACSRLLSDPARRRALAQEAFELVRRRYSWERKVDELLELYDANLRSQNA